MLASAATAEAHTIGLSSGEYRRQGARIDATLSFARADVARLVPSLDGDRDGHVSAFEVEQARDELRRRLVDRIDVRAAGPCRASLEDAALADQDGLLVRARYACDGPTAATVDVGLLGALPRGHRHVARVVVGDAVVDHALSREAHVFEVPAPSATTAAAHEERSPSLLAMGLEHVLTGFDHLLFLLGLALARVSPKKLALVVTAFTIGHCASLAAVAMNVVVARPGIVEPLIAASVVYAGLHNLLRRDVAPSAILTGAFGLIHGAGFAAALLEHPVTRERPLFALLTFNAGVEVGQLAALAAALPLVFLVGDVRLGRLRVRDVLSALVALAGLVWLITRLR